MKVATNRVRLVSSSFEPVAQSDHGKVLTLGEFITCVYGTCDDAIAGEIVSLAVNAGLVVYREPSRAE